MCFVIMDWIGRWGKKGGKEEQGGYGEGGNSLPELRFAGAEKLKAKQIVDIPFTKLDLCVR